MAKIEDQKLDPAATRTPDTSVTSTETVIPDALTNETTTPPIPPIPLAPESNEPDILILPAVGEKIWYCLRPDGEWILSEVIDHIGDMKLEESMTEGAIHVRVPLNRRIHRSASAIAYRQNVPHGTDPGCWNHEKPFGADEAFARRKVMEQMQIAARREVLL